MEVRFADLEHDPLRTLRRIYDGLSLGGFEQVQPLFERYVAGLEMSGFRKNAHRWAGGSMLGGKAAAGLFGCLCKCDEVVEVVEEPCLLVLCWCCSHGLPAPAPPHLHPPPLPSLLAGA